MSEVSDFLDSTDPSSRGTEGEETEGVCYPNDSQSQTFHKYKITKEDYNKMYVSQRGCCSICGKHQTEFKKRLCIDHNHKLEGKESLRGLLCQLCNSILGFAHDDPKILTEAIRYLNYHG